MSLTCKRNINLILNPFMVKESANQTDTTI